MKLSSSPSVSSTTTSSSGIFPTTKSSVSGFLSFLLRKLLCSTNLPTHPSDHLQEIDMNPQKPDDDSATPNLVARLMGLDSMPDIHDQKILSSITRSKSVNSVDCRVEEMQRKQHRRAKTSVSFRETPSYFELEDDDFFVISFDNGGKNGKPRSKKAKGEVGGRDNEQRRRRRGGGGGMAKEQRPRFKFEESNSEALVLEIENSDQVRARNSKKKKGKCLDGAKIETESESENSSPVSVLDHSLFISDNEVHTSAEKDAKNINSSPRRKLASALSNLEHSPSDHETCPKEKDQNPTQSTKGKQSGVRRKGGRRRQKREMLNKVVCRLAEAEIAELEWMCNGGLMRDFKNWGAELSLHIVDQLLDEVVHQLI